MKSVLILDLVPMLLKYNAKNSTSTGKHIMKDILVVLVNSKVCNKRLSWTLKCWMVLSSRTPPPIPYSFKFMRCRIFTSRQGSGSILMVLFVEESITTYYSCTYGLLTLHAM
mmetsp:Transcript_30501/g.45432  ORF Transcript_30501/g.45432 Transcript_30501/m.45432 type:complete len:112 (-) Transcript_30501:1586-1921(-)